MHKTKHLLISFVLLLNGLLVLAQGSTTSSISGKITTGTESLPGATVVIIHKPSGSQLGTITDGKGFFRTPNLDPGGPYSITVTYVGYENYVKDNVYLTLGQTFEVNVNLQEKSLEVDEVVVVVKRKDIFDGNRTGSETVVDKDQIANLPSVGRDFSDFTKLTPQATIDENGGISIAGTNNRYNAISIDGAVNNDVFGLSATGTNGGQTGGTPISVDAIEQFQISLAPYDIRQSGFAGASINAVTRRGNNNLDGSVYYFMRNQNIAGRTPGAITDISVKKDPTFTPQLLPDFSSNTYGFRLGGPIVKNKIFFFINSEIQRDQTPQPFAFGGYQGTSTQSQIDDLANFLKNTYSYDPGGYIDNIRELKSNKFLARIDWNLNKNHRLTLRHSYTYNESISPSRSTSSTINFYNRGVFFPSTTNSTALEFKSNFNKFSNNLIIGYTSVFDDRDPMGSDFPHVQINDGAGRIYFGSEEFSTGNQLKQNILTFSDNFNYYLGKHVITVGMNHEFSHSYNLFIRQNYGSYIYSNLNSFLTNAPAYEYNRSYSLVDDKTGDGSAAAADFNVLQLGAYVQDEFQVTSRLKVTAGIRLDVPIFLDNPVVDTTFNNQVIAKVEAAGYDLQGAKAGEMPDPQLMFAPRIGFNYDVTGNKSTQIRGGAGIFTSRIPLVWPGGIYTNSGVLVGGFRHRSTDVVGGSTYNITFRPDWNDQYVATDFGRTVAVPSGEMNLFSSDFKFPQVFRSSLAIDQKLPANLVLTVEYIYSKTLNNINYYNYNVLPSIGMTSPADTRAINKAGSIDNRYSRIMLGTNTDKGYSYNITGQLSQNLPFGVSWNVAYTFGEAKSLNDGASSQNSSQWRYVAQVNGRNSLATAYSDYDLGHRVVAFVNYQIELFKGMSKTSFSLYYNGQSGNRFSYVYGGSLQAEASDWYDLIYVPQDASEINLVDYTPTGGTLLTAAQQWTDLDEFIKNDEYLSSRRGNYAERNGARLDFQHRFDFKVAQDFSLKVGGKKHTLQATFDIFNVGNLLNSDWGVIRYVTYDSYALIRFAGYATDGTTPRFNFVKPTSEVFNIDDAGLISSRWQAQFGIRYIF